MIARNKPRLRRLLPKSGFARGVSVPVGHGRATTTSARRQRRSLLQRQRADVSARHQNRL